MADSSLASRYHINVAHQSHIEAFFFERQEFVLGYHSVGFQGAERLAAFGDLDIHVQRRLAAVIQFSRGQVTGVRT